MAAIPLSLPQTDLPDMKCRGKAPRGLKLLVPLVERAAVCLKSRGKALPRKRQPKNIRHGMGEIAMMA